MSEPDPQALFAQAKALGRRFDPEAPEGFDLPLTLPQALNRAVAKRQAEFLAGRWCVGKLYASAGLSLPLPEYREHAAPGWPPGWTGAITHCRNYAAAVIGPKSHVKALGLDAEALMAEATAHKVRGSILHPDEAHLLDRRDWIDTLTLIFSFKESLYKALSPVLGRFIGFDEVAIDKICPERLSFAPRGPLAQDFPVSAPRQGRWQRRGVLILSAYEWESEQ
ncbi:MAG: 4'-phosphopantetheinyl transferase [Candidatus Melainabacteria bacterium HGW-Melainabacteria-1]|nr:MAG: 4'-phosphopantetheinyl transferase [Candidatus Melainabacteria bacterium HGW-Melainabacteria-1]